MATALLPIDLTGLQTESRNSNSAAIDKVSTLQLCRIINHEDATVALAVESCLDVISQAIDAVTPRVRNGGRLIYIGAGTSGRLGVLDASEIPPTYSASPDQFVGIIAGGDVALRHAREGAEDDREAVKADLDALKMNPELDSLIGLATSGRTPYVLSGLEYAKRLGCVTIGITCVSPSAIAAEGNTDFVIAAITGPEVVTGSTRMKAGTAQKMILNMLSTGVMIKSGKTYGNLMVDMKATNLKLKQRAKNLLRAIGGADCPAEDGELEDLLARCGGKLKLAAAAIVLKQSVRDAQASLDRNGGVLAKVIEEAKASKAVTQNGSLEDTAFVLCIDGGGSKTTAVLLGANGRIGIGKAGPSNLSSYSMEVALSNIVAATKAAIAACLSRKDVNLSNLKLKKVWVALAGSERKTIKSQLESRVAEALGITLGDRLYISSDIDLLPLAADIPGETDSVIVLVAGTGSISMSYRREENLFTRVGRAGGWGRLLGDDGSGYGLGREGLRIALAAAEELKLAGEIDEPQVQVDELATKIFEYMTELHPGNDKYDLLTPILVPDLDKHQTKDAEAATVRRIADISKVVFASAEVSETARHIINNGARGLSEPVQKLVLSQKIAADKTALVLAGGLMQNQTYRDKVLEHLAGRGSQFSSVHFVEDPAEAAARHLLAHILAQLGS